MQTETETKPKPKSEPIKLCDADTQEWLDLREGGIGASEAAAACGVSEWTTPREIYHRKRGELPPACLDLLIAAWTDHPLDVLDAMREALESRKGSRTNS